MPSSYASRKIPRSPRFAHKAPVIQATGYEGLNGVVAFTVNG